MKRIRRQLLITAGVCLVLALAGIGVMFDVHRKLTRKEALT